ncbi:mitochondrial inner membrane protease ATP23-like [Curcuma longa]|uniref:mitochondrial inner membrane protease ATP23-like n=1 Tax=Curcuma longa TaxID=136217 RepID=UPI003D9F335A
MDGAEEGMSSTGAGGSMSHKECVDGITKSLQHPTVRFLREKMEQAGCPVWGRLLMAITCKGQTSAGGYSSGRGITICCNHMSFQNEIDQVIIHELIHAYDDCRAKNLDWTNCAHHACSEIRANHLSGDCHYKRELLRGFLKIRGHEQECVRRRSLKSVQSNPHCSDITAKDAIEAIWGICYNDTTPFDRAP